MSIDDDNIIIDATTRILMDLCDPQTVTNAADDTVLARVRERVISADLETRTARWVRFEDWKDNPDPVPALFIDTRVRLD